MYATKDIEHKTALKKHLKGRCWAVSLQLYDARRPKGLRPIAVTKHNVALRIDTHKL